MEKPRSRQLLTFVSFMLLMTALGASDSLRGVFAPAFQEHFSLNSVMLSAIIVASYGGNLVFLCLGGRLMDQYDRKKATMVVLALWLFALAVYLGTDSYPCLLLGMFCAMGASTLLNTAVNILTPSVFLASPGMMVNLFFFVQGIGTSASQNLAGRVAGSYGAFKRFNVILAVLGMLSLILLWKADITDSSNEKKPCGNTRKEPVSYRMVIRHPGFGILVVMFGLYFVAEHGIMNWLVSYGSQGLFMDTSKAAVYLSGFFGAVTIGRLIFAPVVSKIGAFRSILWFGGIGCILFVAGILLGGRGLWLLSLSGLAISILYPTMVFMIRCIYEERMLATALGAVISVATLFDIGFNLLFGTIVDAVGYRLSFLVIPLCMIGFYMVYLYFYVKYRHRERL